MPPVFYMLEKELLQHKVITRLPLFVFCFSLLLILLAIYGFNENLNFSVASYTESDAFNVQQGFTALVTFGASLVSYLLSILYLSKAICKDRQEGTLAFWRSMPVLDISMQLVKLCIGLIVIPIICSLLVLSAELFLWFLSLISPEQVRYLIGEITSLSVIQNYTLFVIHMLCVSFALLPFTSLIFATSQLSNSPLLLVLIGIYTLKILSSVALPGSGLENFFYQFIDFPNKLVFGAEPMQVLNSISNLSIITMYIVTLGLFIVGLKLQKENELRVGKIVIRTI